MHPSLFPHWPCWLSTPIPDLQIKGVAPDMRTIWQAGHQEMRRCMSSHWGTIDLVRWEVDVREESCRRRSGKGFYVTPLLPCRAPALQVGKGYLTVPQEPVFMRPSTAGIYKGSIKSSSLSLPCLEEAVVGRSCCKDTQVIYKWGVLNWVISGWGSALTCGSPSCSCPSRLPCPPQISTPLPVTGDP
jgi:hypothetical protein